MAPTRLELQRNFRTLSRSLPGFMAQQRHSSYAAAHTICERRFGLSEQQTRCLSGRIKSMQSSCCGIIVAQSTTLGEFMRLGTRLLAILFLFCLPACAFAQEPAAIPLWPGVAPGSGARPVPGRPRRSRHKP